MASAILFGLLIVIALALLVAYTPRTEKCEWDHQAEWPEEREVITEEQVLAKGLTPAMMIGEDEITDNWDDWDDSLRLVQEERS